MKVGSKGIVVVKELIHSLLFVSSPPPSFDFYTLYIFFLSYRSLDLAETFATPFCKDNIICSLFYEFIPLFVSVQFLLMLKQYLSKSLILVKTDPISSWFW